VGDTDLQSLKQRKELNTTFWLPAAAFPPQACAGRLGPGSIQDPHVTHPPVSGSAMRVEVY